MTVEHLWYSRHVFHAAAAKSMHQRERSAAVAASDIAAAAAARAPPADNGGEDTEVPPEVPQSLAVEATSDQEEEGGDEASRAELSSFTVSGPAAAALLAGAPPRGARRRGTPAWRAFSPHAKLLAISALCNRARPTDAPPPVPMAGATERAITGSAADAALFRYAEMFFAVASARAQFPRIFDVPFSSATKFAATIVSDRADPSGRHLVMLKGAPEVILARCATWVFGREERPIDDEFREQARASSWEAMRFCTLGCVSSISSLTLVVKLRCSCQFTHSYERFGSMGERVLGFAYAMAPPARVEAYAREPERIPTSGCVFVGLISLVDPPRKGVPDAIATCRTAGIRVTMVTGDHPLTAEAIARKVGILTRPSRHDIAHALGVAEASIPLTDERVEAVVITGEELGRLHSDADWDALLSKPELVLARTSPQQKLTLVENYQRRGEIVAVTGDGVNDAPALKRAQVGVAMGSAGASDVAREAADIVLLDDNFASIVAAIEEGRTLFDNLKARRRCLGPPAQQEV
jgi:sodium/potassium-transporting ATPase subunit alpha